MAIKLNCSVNDKKGKKINKEVTIIDNKNIRRIKTKNLGKASWKGRYHHINL